MLNDIIQLLIFNFFITKRLNKNPYLDFITFCLYHSIDLILLYLKLDIAFISFYLKLDLLISKLSNKVISFLY